MDDSRYSRNVAFFGQSGQDAIADLKVTIAGLGGLGSHVAQQLAYLGTTNLGLIDGDIITESSLNRVVGSTPSDIADRTPKVLCAQRTIKTIQPHAEVDAVEGLVERPLAERAAELIRASDVVVGCLDAELPRLLLTDACSSAGITYIDAATDTGGEADDWFGGRIVVCTGVGCLSCLGLLDQRQIRLEQMTQDEARAERQIYGFNPNIGATGPAVVSINGVVASMAVTELIVYVTGIRPPALQITYRGDIPRVTLSNDSGREGCPYCAAWRGAQGRSDPSSSGS